MSELLPRDASVEKLVVLQADLDDETPEVFGGLPDRLVAAGARDAVILPILMKKGRPGHRVEVLTRPDDADRLCALLFTETSTLGVRRIAVERVALDRTAATVNLPSGHPVRLKVALWDGRVLRAKPEHADCVAIAEATTRPLRDVLDDARHAAAAWVLEQNAEK